MYTIRSIERAFKLLECFTAENSEIGVTELARAIELPKATVFRIAETLEALGYLNKNESSQTYTISAKFLGLGRVFLDNLDVRMVAIPYMKKIRDSLDETVSLYIQVNDRRVCVERSHSSLSLRRVVTVGEEVSIARGASGRVLLAFSNKNYGVDKDLLEKVRVDGYAYSENERGEGISAVSVPLRNFKGKLVAALTISGPSFRYNADTLTRYIDLMKETSAEISARLGYKAS